MDLTSATLPELETFLSDFNITIDNAEKPSLLKLSFVFLRTIKFCGVVDAEAFVQAQCFIIKAIAIDGIRLDGVTDVGVLTRKSVGAGSVKSSKTFEFNKELSGADSLSVIKRIPMSYNLLKPYICNSGGGVRSFSLAR